MCYNARYLLEKALKRARYFYNAKDIDYFKKALERYDKLFQVSGYAHPEIIIYTNNEPYKPIPSFWGLIPHWVKNEADAKKIWNKTLNARGETILEKPSFRDAAKYKRCIIPVEGFYEHHHHKGKTYPFYISRKDNEPLMLAGLWSEWTNKATGEVMVSCSIVTTKANELMQNIHNNPKLPEARMPLILNAETEEEWVKNISTNHIKKVIEEIMAPYPASELTAHTVRKLSGRQSPGNVPEANAEFVYDELQIGLFD